ncbi:hypothetical protein ABID65_001831 [Bradyrhizobium sp. S3.9.2]
MERSEIRDSASSAAGFPDCASLHPGYNAEAYGSPYFFTLLASILTAGSSILVVNAVVTSNGFSMPR